MARIFNRAYNQADRILNGSGLSSLVHRQGGGGMITSVHGKPIPRYVYRDNGGPVIRRFMGGYTDEDAGVEETSYGGGVEDWGISAADMEAAYSTGAFGPELAKESFFDPPDIESQRVHGSSPHDVIRHGEAYGKPPGSQEQSASDYYLGGDTSLSDYENDGQPSLEMQRRREINRQEGLRGMIQGGFNSVEEYEKAKQDWIDQAEKSRSDEYWNKYGPYGNWVTENYASRPGGMKGTSLVLPEQAPISRDEAINKVEQDFEDGLISGKEAKEQIDHIFIYGDVVNRDMGRLKTASRLHRERTIDRDRAKGYFPIAPPKRRTYKGGGKVMPGGLSGINKSININGQPHSLAWINPGEASALRNMGGSGRNVGGIPAYFYIAEGEEYEDVVVGPTGESPTEESYMVTDTTTDDSQSAPPTLPLPPSVGGRYEYDPYTKPPIHGTTASDKFIHQKAYSEQGLPRLTLTDLQEGNYDSALRPFISELSGSSLGRAGAYNALLGIGPKGIQDLINAYHTGYTGGGPLDTYKYISKGIGNEYISELGLDKIKLTGKETEKEMEEIYSNLEKEAKRLGGTFTRKKAFDTGGIFGKDYQKTLESRGLQDNILAKAAPYVFPGGLASRVPAYLANFMTDMSGHLGSFTTSDGKTFSVRDYGDLVEKDIYTPSQSDNDPMPSTKKRRLRPVQQASVSEEVDKPLTGIAALQADRPEVASIAEKLQPQFDNIASIFGRDKAAEMLNQPVNIFA